MLTGIRHILERWLEGGFTDEWGGGLASALPAKTIPTVGVSDAIFNLNEDKLSLAS